MNREVEQLEPASIDPALIFSWRRSFRRRWSMTLAVLLVIPMIAVLFAAIHVRGFSVQPAQFRRGELLLFVENSSTHDWLENVSQKTPFPLANENNRIEPLSAALLREITSMKFEPQAELRDIVVPDQRPVFDMNQVLPGLPDIVAATVPEVVSENRQVQPRLKLLARLTPADLPAQWPDYFGDDEPLQGMKYLLEIDAKGAVVSCIAANKETDKRNVSLENWIKTLVFPQPLKVKGWLGCEVTVKNRDD